jgi:hypothetical protein
MCTRSKYNAQNGMTLGPGKQLQPQLRIVQGIFFPMMIYAIYLFYYNINKKLEF